MKKIFFSLFLMSFLSISAQVNLSKQSTENRWTYGGGVGLSFGSDNYFNLQVSPKVGYLVAPNFELGLIGNVSWQSTKYYKSTLFGIGPFANYYIGKSFYLGANLQQYFSNSKSKTYDYSYSTDETALYLGGGYLQPLGNRAYMQIGVMYNVLWKENKSIFENGFVPSIGFTIGL